MQLPVNFSWLVKTTAECLAWRDCFEEYYVQVRETINWLFCSYLPVTRAMGKVTDHTIAATAPCDSSVYFGEVASHTESLTFLSESLPMLSRIQF